MALDPHLTRIYQVTPEEIIDFRNGLTQAGIVLPVGNSGQFQTQGVTIDFIYDGKAALTITIADEPWYDPISLIWANIEKYIPTQP